MRKEFIVMAAMAAGATLPAAAFAQDAICAGVPAGRWVADNPAASDLSAAQSAYDVTTFVPAGGGAAVSQFTLSSPATVRYEAKGSFGGDPIAWLYDTAGNEVSMNDDGAVDFGVRAEVDLAPGSYCLKVADVNNGLLPVEIRIGRADHEAMLESVDEMTYGGGGRCSNAGDTFEADLGGGEFRQTVSVGRDVAVWFTLSETTGVTIEGIGHDNDPLLYLEDAQGNHLAENDDYNGLDARIDMYAPMQPGRYCVAVATYSEDGSNVDVVIRTLDPEEAARAQIASGAVSPLPGSGYPVVPLGVLDGRIVQETVMSGDYMWLSLEVRQPSMVRIDALVVDGSDPQLALFDDAGREIMRNDDWSGVDYSARIIEELMPGTYMIGLNSVSGSSERTRLVIDQFVRVP